MSNEHPERIQLDEACLCLDCRIIFCVRNRICPTCGAESGWYLVQNSNPLLVPLAKERQDETD